MTFFRNAKCEQEKISTKIAKSNSETKKKSKTMQIFWSKMRFYAVFKISGAVILHIDAFIEAISNGVFF